MKFYLVVIVLLALVAILSYACRNDKEQHAKMLIDRVEEFKRERGRLPENAAEMGIEELMDNLAFYKKENDLTYIVWYGQDLGESIVYRSKTKKTERRKEYTHLNTFVFGTGLYLNKYCVYSSGAGMFYTGEDYEWILNDSVGHELSLGITCRDNLLDVKMIKDSLFTTLVSREASLDDLSEIIYEDKEIKKDTICLTDYGFKVKEHSLDKSTNSIEELSNNMTLLRGGTVDMVSKWSSRTKPENIVEVKDFYICKYEVSQELWVSIMGYNPSLFKNAAHCPVENVDWYDIQEFIAKLNAKHNTKYRLPTEAEWEYAARGGETERYYYAYKDKKLDTLAWYRNNSNNSTHPVGSKAPNRYGLYDVIGNVGEWCSDWYEASYLPPDSTRNQTKVVRGGSWNSYYSDCNPYERRGAFPKYGASNSIGFRLAMDYE